MKAADYFGRAATDREKMEFMELEKENASWEVDFYKYKYVMHLDLGYGEDRKRDIFTAAFFKDHTNEHPLGVTFTLPKRIDKKDGLLIAFANKKGSATRFKDADSYVADFSYCNEQDCSLVLDVFDKNSPNTDLARKIISKMSKANYMALGFLQHGKLETLNIPLSYFQSKYLELKEIKQMPAKQKK